MAVLLVRPIEAPEAVSAAPRAILRALLAASLLFCTTGPLSAADAPATDGSRETAWAFSASLYTYFLADDSDYCQPTVTAGRGWLHLEARYNYEAPDTGSAWLGYGFSGGDALAWEVTPIAGAVFGEVDGWAPGFEASLRSKTLEISTENEYVVATRADSESFFYSWSELGFLATDWLSVGLAAQRTRARKSEREAEPGVFGRISCKKLEGSAYAFFPGEGHPTFVAQFGVRF